MSVTGFDAIHLNVSAIPAGAAVVMGYDTGSPDIVWSAEDWQRFATKRQVHIDQRSTGSPSRLATVRDVEPGAWQPADAVTHPWDSMVERPTIYCDRNDLPRVTAAGWHGDLWLAIPGWQEGDALPDHGDCTVVAVQTVFGDKTDSSVVLDAAWPFKDTPVTGYEFTYPKNLRQTVSVDLSWDAVPPADGHAPTGYTVVVLGLDNHEYFRTVTPDTHVTATGLHTGWTFNVLVWANGGTIAPPHAVIQVQT